MSNKKEDGKERVVIYMSAERKAELAAKARCDSRFDGLSPYLNNAINLGEVEDDRLRADQS